MRTFVLVFTLAVSACTTAPTTDEADAVRAQIEATARRAGLSFQSVDVEPDSTIQANSLDDTARCILVASALLSSSPEHRRCPQLGLFRKAEIPMIMTWLRAGDSETLVERRFHIAPGPTPEDRLIEEQQSNP